MIIAVKGAIGTGKSTVSMIFQESGYVIINADEIVHELYENDTDLIKRVNEEFNLVESKPSKGLLGKIKKRKINGVDRKKLGEIVFNNPLELEKLEKIVHPVLRVKMLELMQGHDKVLIDCQIIEKLGIDYDLAILLHASRNTIIKRVQERDGKSEELINQILNQQLKNEILSTKTYAISSENGMEDVKKQISQIKELKKNG